jgi:hypothetical protein
MKMEISLLEKNYLAILSSTRDNEQSLREERRGVECLVNILKEKKIKFENVVEDMNRKLIIQNFTIIQYV